jgi:hypothetical protein
MTVIADSMLVIAIAPSLYHGYYRTRVINVNESESDHLKHFDSY